MMNAVADIAQSLREHVRWVGRSHAAIASVLWELAPIR